MVVVDKPQKNLVKGDLTEEFAAKIDLQNREVAALMGEVNPDTPNVLAGGMQSSLGLTDAKLSQIKEKKSRKNLYDFIIRELIRNATAKLNEIIALHQERMEELLEQMADADQRLENLDYQHKIIQNQLEHFQNNGRFELDETGRLRDKEAEAIIAEYEEKTGQSIDRSIPASYESILNIQVKIEEQRIQTKQDIEDYTAEYEYRKKQIEKATEIKGKLESQDVLVNEIALTDFDDFMNGYKSEMKSKFEKETKSLLKSSTLLVDMNLQSDNLENNQSFGFSEIKENKSEITGSSTRNKKSALDINHNLKDSNSTKKLNLKGG